MSLRSVLLLTLLVGLSFACNNDEDCNLNGICVSGHAGHGGGGAGGGGSSSSSSSKSCRCDPGWRGIDCGELDVRPAKRDSGYNRTGEGISSWGSKIVRDPHDRDLYHLFLAEFTHHCGLDYWSPYSRIIRAESTHGAGGPYTFASQVVGPFSHNPTVVYSPADRMWLMYYIGCPQVVNDTCTAPSFTCGPGNFINGESGISVQSSPDLLHWTAHGQVFMGTDNDDWDADTTNPSPWPLALDVHAGRRHGGVHHGEHSLDQSILLAYRGCPYNCSGDELISLAAADTFRGPYTRLNGHEPIFSNPAEDPFIWTDRRGNWHMLVHSLEPEGGFGDGPKVGRHAFARAFAGPWTFNDRTLAFSTRVEYDDGGSVDFYRRERPQLYFSDDGLMRPLYLTTGVQEVDDPMSYTVIVPLGNGWGR